MMARGSTDKITTECPWQTVFSKFKHKQSYLEVTYFITSLAYSVAPHRQVRFQLCCATADIMFSMMSKIRSKMFKIIAFGISPSLSSLLSDSLSVIAIGCSVDKKKHTIAYQL